MIKEAKKQCEYIQVQLDHAKSLEYIEAMASTNIFDIIMVDGSYLAIEDNIHFTNQAKSICLKYGCQIEGEVGHIPDIYINSSSIQYTNVNQAKNYCDKTGVDFLAVSVGNAHGYKPKGDLNYRLIEKIHDSLDIPLVLHGADFLGKSNLKQAIRSGIYKINIGPQLRKIYFETIANYPLKRDFECDIRKPMLQAIFEMKRMINDFLKI
jgi:tagatose 1,6-diphosphate aldolase GatY/KbaY